ncbi:MAG TPA: PH domain-containing protein [Chthoniobacteraceae bacterium]|jgi:uncharacterized membrane protein YdbT with pleckstrin-like domain|nr:PH domain-containing protein [Chthoniobacteraceae bacterium]
MNTSPTIAGEQIIWKGSVSQWHYAGRWLLIVLFLAGAVAALIHPLPFPVPGPTVAAVLAGVALVLLLTVFIDRARRTYTITDHRISTEFGIISKQSNEIRLHDVRSINLTMKGISGIFGIGRLEFSSAATDDAEVVFWNVGGAEGLRDQVRGLQTRGDVANHE